MAVKKTKSSTKTKPKTSVKKKTVTKAKAVAKTKAKVTKKTAIKKNPTTKASVKKKAVRKVVTKPKEKAVKKTTAKAVKEPKKSAAKKAATEKSTHDTESKQFTTLKPNIPSFRKPSAHLVERRRPMKARSTRSNHFSFMKAPGTDHEFDVGDTVEVFCDHDKSKERIRDWIKGIVVQVDNKMVAVQFRTNVYLTDGWMVPDRILWYPLTSEHIRSLPSKKKTSSKKEFLPDF